MKKRIFSVVYMFLITFIFTAGVSGVKLFSEDRIRTNEQVKLRKIVINVLGIAGDKKIDNERAVNLFRERVKIVDVDGKTIYIGYRKDSNTPLGYAFAVGGPGFWGPIQGMVAVDVNAEKLIGVAFYKLSETPGLGARITEDWFRKQFVGLRIFPIEGDKKIFYLRPEGYDKGPGDLDAVTGATGTSRGVQAFLNKDLDNFLRKTLKSFKKQVG